MTTPKPRIQYNGQAYRIQSLRDLMGGLSHQPPLDQILTLRWLLRMEPMYLHTPEVTAWIDDFSDTHTSEELEAFHRTLKGY